MGNNRRSFSRLEVQNQKLLDAVQGWVDVLPTPPEILNIDVMPLQQGMPEHEGSTLRSIAKGINTRAWLQHCISYGKDSFPGRENALASYIGLLCFLFNI